MHHAHGRHGGRLGEKGKKPKSDEEIRQPRLGSGELRIRNRQAEIKPQSAEIKQATPTGIARALFLYLASRFLNVSAISPRYVI